MVTLGATPTKNTIDSVKSHFAPSVLPVPLVIGSLVVLGAVILALFAPWIAPYDPILQNTANTLQGPSLAHPFGTDNFLADILMAAADPRIKI